MPETTVHVTRKMARKQSGATRILSSGVQLVSVTRTLEARGSDGKRRAGALPSIPIPPRLHQPRQGLEDRRLRPTHAASSHVKKTTAKVLARGARRRVHAKQWLADRASSRRGFLETHAVQAPTKGNYRQLLAMMAIHLWYWGVDLSEEVPKMSMPWIANLDEALNDYCDAQFFEGEPGSLGSQLYSALSDYWPEIGRGGSYRLPRFYRARQAWRRLAPGRTRDPLPFLHLVLVMKALLRRGRVAFAAACLLMWSCYLRPSEILDLHAEDVLAPTSSCPHVSLMLHPYERGKTSKVGEFDDGVTMDMAKLQWFGPWLLRQSLRRPKGAKLFSLGYPEMSKMFQKAMEEWGLKDATMYRLRHGGASHDIVHGHRHIVEVKKRGRWSTDQSLKRYAKAVRLQKVELEAGQEALVQARMMSQRLAADFASRDFE